MIILGGESEVVPDVVLLVGLQRGLMERLHLGATEMRVALEMETMETVRLVEAGPDIIGIAGL